jgi:hypothetical protein
MCDVDVALCPRHVALWDGAAWRAGKIRRIAEWGKPRPMSPAERARFITQMAEVRTKVPAAKPFAFDTRHRIDSFLVGKELS